METLLLESQQEKKSLLSNQNSTDENEEKQKTQEKQKKQTKQKNREKKRKQVTKKEKKAALLSCLQKCCDHVNELLFVSEDPRMQVTETLRILWHHGYFLLLLFHAKNLLKASYKEKKKEESHLDGLDSPSWPSFLKISRILDELKRQTVALIQKSKWKKMTLAKKLDASLLCQIIKQISLSTLWTENELQEWDKISSLSKKKRIKYLLERTKKMDYSQ